MLVRMFNACVPSARPGRIVATMALTSVCGSPDDYSARL
jgi:hypothetical protein